MNTISIESFNQYTIEEAILLKNMYDTITKLNLWDWLKNFTPDESTGGMFTNTPEVKLIYKEVENEGHKGISFVYCLMHMNMIAKMGVEKYQCVNL